MGQSQGKQDIWTPNARFLPVHSPTEQHWHNSHRCLKKCVDQLYAYQQHGTFSASMKLIV